jgi:hypothetical protein
MNTLMGGRVDQWRQQSVKLVEIMSRSKAGGVKSERW